MRGSLINSSAAAWVPGMANSAATACVDSGRRLHTLTISTPATARSPGMWRSLVLPPAPIRPTRSGVSEREVDSDMAGRGEGAGDTPSFYGLLACGACWPGGGPWGGPGCGED